MAARRTHVPKFGNWDANDHMPYTVVFDHARQGRGKPINPNDPEQNPAMFPAGRGAGAPGRRPSNPNEPEEEGSDHHPQTTQQQGGLPREGSGSGSGNSRATQQPAEKQQPHQVAAGAAARRGNSGSGNVPPRGPSADPRRPSRDNAERESPSTSFSADQSPSHPAGQIQNRANRLGGASPAWDPTRRKSTGEDNQNFAPPTPNRSRLSNGKTNAGKDESSQKGPSATLPKFGAWDAQDPASGDGFTVIFNNQRNEKKTGGPVNIPRTPDHKNDNLYDESNTPGYAKRHGRRRSWFCWCPPDAKA